MFDELMCVTEHKHPFCKHTHRRTHLLPVADSLLFEAQLPLQVLDDGVLGSLDVGVGGDARRPAAQRLLGKRFPAMRTEQDEDVMSTGKVKGAPAEVITGLEWCGSSPASVGPGGSVSDF